MLSHGLYGKQEEAFLSSGFINWKDACASFRKQEASKYHCDVVHALTKTQKSVGDMLSQAHSEQRKQNSQMLLTIMQNIQFLGRQSLALRGHSDDESNFTQLLKLRGNE